ncbi:SGNH hydrolase-type esterase domain-containing protein [Rhexocercosporidium sp. MPI-PUGE-AT-0058]|nr:SGNH hydrolase-type esterase domain-containing protein [Rhexocercosporidium sp. MPI-PUGE-AT-0058]
MRSHTLKATALISVQVQFSVVNAFPQLLPGFSRLFGRQTADADVDYEDLSYVKKWAAIGDSYAAGIGAGTKLADSGPCARYNDSYPNLINTFDTMSGTQKFDFLACSGATTPDVVDKQVSVLTDSYDLITVSSGGNDVGLVDILNKCIYQLFSVGDEACDDQLKFSAGLINDTLPGNLDKLTAALKGKANSGGNVYITGYAKFFADTAKDCDSVTWAFWFQLGARVFLTQARRSAMNDLVVSVNQAISDAVKRAGPGFVFVDYDQYFSLTEGRFCEDGVKEPQGDRDGLLFFEWDTSGNTNLKREAKQGGAEIEAGTILRPEIARRQANSSNTQPFDAEIAALIDQARMANSSLQQSLPDGSGPDTTCRGRCLLSDDIKRVFHPQIAGHAIIARAVIWHIALSRSGVAGEGSADLAWGPEISPAADSCAKPDTSPTCPRINGCSCFDASLSPVDSATMSCCSSIGGVPGNANSSSTVQIELQERIVLITQTFLVPVAQVKGLEMWCVILLLVQQSRAFEGSCQGLKPIHVIEVTEAFSVRKGVDSGSRTPP